MTYPYYPAMMPVDNHGNILGTAVNPISIVGGSGGGTAQNAPGYLRIEDGTTTNLATVQAFHNADNQSLTGTAYGILTGGVAQLLNPSNSLDRQRETASDAVTNIGIATGTQQLAWPVTVGPVTSGAITGNTTAQTITVTNVAGTIRGIAWALVVGQALVLEPGTATQEAFTITAINVGSKLVTGIIQKNHSGSAPATAFFYDQARSAMIPDGSPGQGMAAGATYLFNTSLNSGSGGWEGERSANGELDGASGAGTAVAAEYEYNGGGPGGGNYDRARNLQGKGLVTNTLNGNALSAQNQATLQGAALPVVGQPVYLQGGTPEVAYVNSVVGQVLTFTSNLVNTHATGTNVQWDVYATNGPGLNGFLPTGLGVEEEALYDPVSAQYYIERSATQDNADAQNVVMESEALFTGFGSTGRGIERARSVLSKQLVGTANFVNKAQNGGNITLTAPGAAGQTSLTFSVDPSVATFGSMSTPLKAGMAIYLCQTPATPTQVEVVYVLATYTGGTSVPITTTQVSHTATTDAAWESFGSAGPSLTGFLASGMDVDEDAVFDPITGLFYLERSATADAMAAQNIVAETNTLWNGATFDRQRGNVDTGALITAAGATTTQTTADQLNTNGRGVKVVLNTTVIGTGSVTLSIQGKDTASGVYYTILSGAAVVTNVTNVYSIYPGMPATANVSANDLLPRTWRVVVTANNANAATYTVGASVIV